MHLFTPLYSHNRLHSSHHRLIVSYTVSSPTCSCTLSLHDALPISSAVVADGAPQIPADLDLLCELVLNETSEEIPETTRGDRKSTRLNSSHVANSYAVSCMKKKTLIMKSHGNRPEPYSLGRGPRPN